MRFFAHDGKSTHGPAGIEELLKLPGFDGDTLVCPVGSSDSADWKPALAYPPFKKALLDAAPTPAPAPISLPPIPKPPAPPAMPTAAPAPAPAMPPPAPVTPAAPAVPAAKTVPCPLCAHANLEEARFCNACGERMDGRLKDVPKSPFTAPAPTPAPVAAPDPFAHLDPMLSYPTEPTPLPLPKSPRPLQPGKMGQLAAFEESAPSEPDPLPPLAPAVVSVPVWKRPTVLSALAGAALVAAGLAYVTLNKNVPGKTVAEPTPAAPTPMPEAAAFVSTTAPNAIQPLTATPPAVSSLPVIPPPQARKEKVKSPKPNEPPSTEPSIAEAKPKRARKLKSKIRGKRAAKAVVIQEKQDGSDPLLEALLTDATSSTAEDTAHAASETVENTPQMIGERPTAKPSQFTLPGLQRPVSASDHQASLARAPRPAAEEIPPTQDAGLDVSASDEPEKSLPTPGIEDAPVKYAEADQLALVQIHEQFYFCAQLLAQEAYGDHYDSCLCKDMREASPYRGRRGFYAAAKKKEADSGRLETTAKIRSSKIDNGVAKIIARWKTGPENKGRDSAQTWKLEDGLWCQAL